MQSNGRFTGDPAPDPNPGPPRGGHAEPAVSPFGRLLNGERLAAGLTVRELAARSGVSARAIEYLEGGQTLTPRRATRQQLARGLQLGERAAHRFTEGSHDGPAHPEPIRHNLPNPLSSFVARAQERQDLARALSGRTRRRLITLYGPGGIGKTRLALTVAAALLEQFPGGVYLIDLAPVESGPWIEVAIANALGVRDDNPTALGAMIMAHLRERRTLLILDNCEHLIAPCAALVGRLLASAPRLHIVATTREPLGLPGELVRRLPALSLPPAADPDGAATEQLSAIAASEAVQLFVARAALVSPGFTLSAKNAVPIAAICRRLDGLPLALELAASRLTALPLGTLAAELDLALQAGGSGRRGVHAHQRTIRATLDWSFALLSEPERALLRRLASFAGTWNASAAAAVCGDRSTPELPRLLAALVAKSLVNVAAVGQRAPGLPGEERYRLLETVRQYARDRLREADEEGVQGSRLCNWTIETLESVESPLDGGPDGARWLSRVETELTNLRAARAWALEHDPPRALRLISATWPYAFARLGHDAGRYLLRLALEAAPGPSPWRAAALQGLGFLSLFHDLSAARGHLAEALALAEAAGEGERLRALRWQLAFACVTAGAIGEAERHLSLGWPAVADDPHPGRRSPYRIVRGFVAIARGDFPRARHELAEAEREAVSAEQPLFRCIALARLGALHLRYGHLTIATANFTALVTLAERLGSWFYRCVGQSGLAQVMEWSGELAAAEATYAAALAISVESGGSRLERAMVLLGQGRIALYRRQPAPALARLEEGHALVIQLNHGTLRRDFASPLAFALWRNGQVARAAERFDEALTLNATGDPTTLARCLDGLAYLAVEREGAAVPAARWLASAAVLREQIQMIPRPIERATIDTVRTALARQASEGNAADQPAQPFTRAEAIASARAWLAQVHDQHVASPETSAALPPPYSRGDDHEAATK